MENKKNKDRNFLGIWIPKDIYLNKELSWLEKILLVEIESLDNQDGCFASNDYFSEFLDVTKTTISSAISKLKKLGFVEQVSFDGRKRVLKICESAYKKTEMQTPEKTKVSIDQNLKHNKTDIKQDNNSNKNIKNKTKSFLNLDKKDQKKIHDIQNGSVCIEVDELKNNQMWLEHTARHLKVSMFWINQLLKEFISEQKLKDDSFKSQREQKSHFLNWSKIQVAKNRKTDDRWGRNDPSHVRIKTKRKDMEIPQPTEKEKKEMHLEFLKTNLLDPYKKFIETNQFVKIRDFGSLVSNELKKHGMLFDDKFEIEKYNAKIKSNGSSITKKKSNISTISSVMKVDRSAEMVNQFILKRSFEEMKNKKINLEKIINEK